MDINVLYQYVDMFCDALNLAPLMGDVFEIEVLPQEELISRCHEHKPEEDMTDTPVAWYLSKDKKTAILLIQDDLFDAGKDDRYGLECMFVAVAEIYYHFSGYWELIEQYKRNVFFKYVPAGIEAYREFFCAYLTNAAISVIFSGIGRDDYTPDKRKSMSLHILKKTIMSQKDASHKMSVIIYCLSKLASAENKAGSVTDLSSVTQNKIQADALNQFYRTILVHLADNVDGRYLNDIGKYYQKLYTALSGR